MWFKRSDGMLFEVDAESVAGKRMIASSEYEECDAEGNPNEGQTDSEQSPVGSGEAKGNPGQSGAGKRSGARVPDKTKAGSGNAKGTSKRKNVSEKSDNETGDEGASGSGPETTEGQS
jgi:hypothetical protein